LLNINVDFLVRQKNHLRVAEEGSDVATFFGSRLSDAVDGRDIILWCTGLEGFFSDNTPESEEKRKERARKVDIVDLVYIATL